MPSCRFFKVMSDGCYGWCNHPEAKAGDQCVFNQAEVDFCYLREPVMTSMQISKDTLEALREYGYPAERAVSRLLEIAQKSLP